MNVNTTVGTASTAGGTAPPTASEKTKAGFSALDGNAFLQLLIAQLKHQDPTKPVDPTQYVSQLAQFSGVEQAVKTNSLLDGLITTTALSQAEGMIGRTVRSADGALSGIVESVRITSEGSIAVLESGDEIPLGAGVTVS
jgi:flagellar basal-body rod modification protein FlgD